MDDGHNMMNRRSQGHDIGPDEDRQAQMTPSNTGTGTQGDLRQVQMISGWHENAQGEMEVEYETVFINNRNGTFFEPLDETPAPRPQQPTNVHGNDFHKEEERLKTFVNRWSDAFNVQPRDLARNGFYYVGPRDKVKCVFCTHTLHSWEPGDSVEAEHRNHYPTCPFVQGRCSHINVPKSSSENLQEQFNVKSRGATAASSMHDYTARLHTFDGGWKQTGSPINPEALANAGLYWTRNNDGVKCFSCGEVISNWEYGDDPWVEHAKWSPACSFLQSVKGSEFVQDVLKAQNQQQDIESGIANQASVKHEENGYPSGSSQEQERSQLRSHELTTPSQPSRQSHSELPYPEQVSTAQIENDLRSPAAQALLEMEEASLEELRQMFAAIRLEKGAGHNITAEELMDRIRKTDTDMVDMK